MNSSILNKPEFWDQKIKENYDSIIRSPIYQHKLKLILKELKKSQGNILDVGIGYGFIEDLIKSKKFNLKMYGLDKSKFSIQNAINKYNGKFVIGNATKIPFDNEFFDYVLTLDILEHLSQLECIKSLLEIRRVMKKKSILMISIPINESYVNRKENHHIQKYDFLSINKQLNKTGFVVVRKYYLTAYRDFYFFKSLLNNIIKLSNPNLLILICKKK